jgi:hypothetical protein
MDSFDFARHQLKITKSELGSWIGAGYFAEWTNGAAFSFASLNDHWGRMPVKPNDFSFILMMWKSLLLCITWKQVVALSRR